MTSSGLLIWFTVDPPRVDPLHVRPKCGHSAPGAGSFRPNRVGVCVRLCYVHCVPKKQM